MADFPHITHNPPVMMGNPCICGGRPTWGIMFDLDASTLRTLYPGELWEHAYVDVRRFLEANGFKHKQGSLYFGTSVIDPVSCIVTVQKLADAFDWFRAAVRDARMLRIEDDTDLKPALDIMARRRPRAKRRGDVEAEMESSPWRP